MITNLWIIFCILIAIIIGLLIAIIVKNENTKEIAIMLSIGLIVGLIVAIPVIISYAEEEPTALDVYQGKTTLKYTVVDSVITDSTVVFRKEDL
jgi:Na+/proline symporter